jgi:hypothetical protein
MMSYRDRTARSVWLIIVSTIILLPLIWIISAGAEFIDLASESLAYRFFYSMRLHAESDPTAWLPQGQLITSMHHIITWLLPRLTPETFRSSANAFSLWSIAIVSAVAIAGLSVAALAPRVTWKDRCLLSILALAPIYATPGAILWVWPDYYALNLALSLLCVVTLQYEWHTNDQRPFLRFIVYGILAGSVAANKISMVAVAFPLLALALVKLASPTQFIARAILLGFSSALTFMFWFFAAGMFRVGWLVNVLPNWFAFVSNPGGDEGFTVIPYLLSGYGITALWLAAAFGLLVVNIRDHRGAAVGGASLISALLCVISIWKRPAGTTVSDSALIFLALGAMMISISGRSRILSATVAFGAVAFMAAAAHTGQWRNVRNAIISSKPVGNEQWEFFEKVRSQADGRPIIYFIPDNNYQYGDVFIVVLKGSADFPSWNMARTGPTVLQRVGLNITFVSEYAFPTGWHQPIPGGALLVWINSAARRPVEQHYSLLTTAKARLGATYSVTDLPNSAATGHIVKLP